MEPVQEVFKSVFEDDNLVVEPHTTANDVPGWDSFTHMSLIVALEKRFKIKFALIDLQQMKNVGEMIALISRKMLGT
jgi:acyl carrier protein